MENKEKLSKLNLASYNYYYIYNIVDDCELDSLLGSKLDT